MKKNLFIILFLSINTFASSLQEIIELSQNNPSIKAIQQEVKVYDNLHSVAESYNYPSLDASYSATYLSEKPVVYLPASFGGEMQMQSQDMYNGALTLSYPLFSGFAISSQINEAKLKKLRAVLKVDDAKRNLYLNIVHTYSSALAIKHIVSSQELALKSTQDSYKKAKGFFDAGISTPSELYRIESMLHKIESELINTKNQYKILLNQLSFMSNSKITEVQELPNIGALEFRELEDKALQKRPDLLSMRLMIEEAQTKVRLAKSKHYPSVVLFAQAAYQGDTPSLNGDGYTNKDKSATGFKINYNLFSGFKDDSQIQAARESRLESEFVLQSYTDKIKTQLYSSYLTYQSLLSQKVSAKAELKAQESYESLVQGEFENQLTDADVLSRAISSSAMARAFFIQTESKLYEAYAKLLLEVDNETFLSSLKN
nr:TolC family protein [uncultured Sulfurimonas sp.]